MLNFTGFQQICYTSLANLTYQAKCRGESRVMFSKDRVSFGLEVIKLFSFSTLLRMKLIYLVGILKLISRINDKL